MERQRRDLAYNAYLQKVPNGNFTRFCNLSQAGKLSYGDPTALARVPVVAPNPNLGEGPSPAGTKPHVLPPLPLAAVGVVSAEPDRAGPRDGEDLQKELRRKLAWAVGSTYRVPYVPYNTWPADYSRRAAERLVEIHGRPG